MNLNYVSMPSQEDDFPIGLNKHRLVNFSSTIIAHVKNNPNNEEYFVSIVKSFKYLS